MGDFNSWIPDRPHYIDAETHAAVIRAQRKRIRNSYRWHQAKCWGLTLFMVLLAYGTLKYFNAF